MARKNKFLGHVPPASRRHPRNYFFSPSPLSPPVLCPLVYIYTNEYDSINVFEDPFSAILLSNTVVGGK